MFEFWFKYPLEWFSRGTLILVLPWWQLLLCFFGLLLLAYIALGYLHLRNRLPWRDSLAVTLLRTLALSLLLLSLSRPLLEVEAPVAQPGVVAVLLDNSASMNLPDASGQPRNRFIDQQFGADGDLLNALRQRFETRMFAYGAASRPLEAVSELDFGDGASDIAGALKRLREVMRGEPLTGLVLVGDGAGADETGLEEALLSLRAADVPVHTVGLGETRYRRDIEIARVRLPAAVLPGSRVVAEIDIRQRGYAGREVELVIEADSRILHQQSLRLETGGQTLRLPLSFADSGVQQLSFEIAAQADEQIAANNRVRVATTVEARRPRILYFEGEPRFEMKFARRALAGDENLALVGLIRTADAKFYRVGIESEDELRLGFPATREDLFAYDALILGSVDISLLSRAQQELIVDFVSERGGGLLLLGGRRAFAEGGYRESALADIMPVIMDPEPQPRFARELEIVPTAAALEHPALLLADDAEQSRSRWQTLPPLTAVNPLREIKAGASLLLGGRAGGDEPDYVVMAAQRYGRGRVLAFAVQNSWLWQMHHEIDLEDQSHELLWRQLSRWLVEAVPPRLGLSASTQAVHAGGSIRLRSEVLTPQYGAVDNADVRAVITSPDGREQVRPLRPDPLRRGYYEADIGAPGPGEYLLRVELEEDGEIVSSREAGLRVSLEGNEFFASEMNPARLRRIAAATGGGFYSADDAAALVDALDRSPGSGSMRQQLELWDMPIVFLLIVALLCGEWAYRRWRRLV